MSDPGWTTSPRIGSAANHVGAEAVKGLELAGKFLAEIVPDYDKLELTTEVLQSAHREILSEEASMELPGKLDYSRLVARTSLQSILSKVLATLFRLYTYTIRMNLQLQVGATLQKKLTELGYGYGGSKYTDRERSLNALGSPGSAFAIHTLAYVRQDMSRNWKAHSKVPKLRANLWLSVYFAQKRTPGDFDQLVEQAEKKKPEKGARFKASDILLNHLAKHSGDLGPLVDLLRRPRNHGFLFHPSGGGFKMLKSPPPVQKKRKSPAGSSNRKDDKESWAEHLAEVQQFLSDSGVGGARDKVTMEAEHKVQEIMQYLPKGGAWEFLDKASYEAFVNESFPFKDGMTIVGADNGVGNIMVARYDDTPGGGKAVKVDLPKFNRSSLGNTPSSQAKGQKKNKEIPKRLAAALAQVEKKLVQRRVPLPAVPVPVPASAEALTSGYGTMFVFKGTGYTNKPTKNNRGIGGFSNPDKFWEYAETKEGHKHMGVPEGFTSQLACYASDNGTDTFARMDSPCTLYMPLRKSDGFRKNIGALAVTITVPEGPPTPKYMRASAFNSHDKSESENGVSEQVLFLAGARGNAVEHHVFEHMKKSVGADVITKGEFCAQEGLHLCGTPDAFLRSPDEDVVLLEMKSVMGAINDDKVGRWALQVYVYLTLYPEAKSARIIVKQFPPSTPHCNHKWIILRVDRVDSVSNVIENSSRMRPCDRVQHILDAAGAIVWCGLKDVSNDENDTTARVMAGDTEVRLLKAIIGATLAKAVKDHPGMKPIFTLSNEKDFLLRSFYYYKRGTKSVDGTTTASVGATGKLEDSLPLGSGKNGKVDSLGPKRFVNRDAVSATSIARTGRFLLENRNTAFMPLDLTIEGHQERIGALVRTPIAHAAKNAYSHPMDRFEEANAARVAGRIIYSLTKAVARAGSEKKKKGLAKSFKEGSFTLSVTVNGAQRDSSADGSPAVQGQFMQLGSDTDSDSDDGDWNTGTVKRVKRSGQKKILTVEQRDQSKKKTEAKKERKKASERVKLMRSINEVADSETSPPQALPPPPPRRPSRTGSRKYYTEYDEPTDSPAGDAPSKTSASKTSRKSSSKTSASKTGKSVGQFLKRGISMFDEALLQHALDLSRSSKGSGYQAHLDTLRGILDQDNARNWTIIDVGGDGNCMLRATSFALVGHEDNHNSVRAEVIRTMRERAEHFRPFMVDHRINSSQSAPDFDQYIREMSTPGVWGDNATLVAIAFAYQRPVVVISTQANESRLFLEAGTESAIDLNNFSPPENAIVLGYLNIAGTEHYVFLDHEPREDT